LEDIPLPPLRHERESKLLRNVCTYLLTFTAVIYEGTIMDIINWISWTCRENSSCGKRT